ncbi:hypothetical protein OAO35_02635 [Euryarchaeota archaeon]|nr:hypothetical protein [Euryarchaeota archaeon]
MPYPWSKKTKEEVPDEIEVIEDMEVTIEESSNIVDDEEIIETTKNEEKQIVWDNDDPRAILLNILKLEGYKMDSGELFNAYKEASGDTENSKIMESFKKGLDQLSEIGEIRSDSDGNITTIQNYDREKSQTTTNEENEVEKKPKEVIDEVKEDTVADVKEIKEENKNEDNADDLDSIIKLKEETDSWLIEKLKNNKSDNDDTELREEVKELKDRIEKLENVIKNITKAFE